MHNISSQHRFVRAAVWALGKLVEIAWWPIHYAIEDTRRMQKQIAADRAPAAGRICGIVNVAGLPCLRNDLLADGSHPGDCIYDRLVADAHNGIAKEWGDLPPEEQKRRVDAFWDDLKVLVIDRPSSKDGEWSSASANTSRGGHRG